MDDPTRHTIQTNHSKYAGRGPAGLEQPVVLRKNGVRHVSYGVSSLVVCCFLLYSSISIIKSTVLINTIPFLYHFFSKVRRLPSGEEKEILSVGLACSECFSGPRLAMVLQPGFDYERSVMEQLMNGDYAAPLSNHTSGGVPEALSQFVQALEPHLPWNNSNELDWCVSLQLEGASAVWAAIDMVLQESMLSSGNRKRKMVAVGTTSYHGPPSTSFGAQCPLWQKSYQVKYPTPTAGEPVNDDELLSKFEKFLEDHADEVGVILFEPQWGSSQAGYPWPKSLLKTYVEMARARGIKIVADEIMCGLGRHGNGSLFVSKDYDLDPDAITFGKAIGGGVYPISGAILKSGRNKLCEAGCSVMQSHTYAGSSVRALMTATEVLKEIPNWLPSVTKLGQEMACIFAYLTKISNGMIIAHGQGLMWGCLFTKEGAMEDESYKSRAIKCFRKHCDKIGVLPYLVPAGGLMVSPHFDIDVGTLYEMGEKLEKVIRATMSEMEWSSLSPEEEKNQLHDMPMIATECVAVDETQCQKYLHQTKSCTDCSMFVCNKLRMRFLVN
jgi:adenosylmethionine-8-amino-7-oxononanoate aminotransferase